MPEPQVPSDALKKSLRKGLATCNTCLPSIEYLEKLAQANPAYQEAVDELRIKMEALRKISETGLSAVINFPEQTI